MIKKSVKIDGYRCKRCGHEWLKRIRHEPEVCPRCKSAYFNRPKDEKADI